MSPISLTPAPPKMVCAKSLQSCPTLWDPMDNSLPGFSVHDISRREYWSGLPAVPSSRRSSRPKDRTRISDASCIGKRFLYHCRHMVRTPNRTAFPFASILLPVLSPPPGTAILLQCSAISSRKPSLISPTGSKCFLLYTLPAVYPYHLDGPDLFPPSITAITSSAPGL